MNDQSRYIIDSRYFDGTCLTFMTDGFRSDFGGETLEEMRVRENNPYLTSVTRQRIDKMLHLYLQALSAPFSEITKEEYHDLMDVLPPIRLEKDSFSSENHIMEKYIHSVLQGKADISKDCVPSILPGQNWTDRLPGTWKPSTGKLQS